MRSASGSSPIGRSSRDASPVLLTDDLATQDAIRRQTPHSSLYRRSGPGQAHVRLRASASNGLVRASTSAAGEGAGPSMRASSWPSWKSRMVGVPWMANVSASSLSTATLTRKMGSPVPSVSAALCRPGSKRAAEAAAVGHELDGDRSRPVEHEILERLAGDRSDPVSATSPARRRCLVCWVVAGDQSAHGERRHCKSTST